MNDTITTYHGRIVAKQISARKWQIFVDGQHIFTTSRGMIGVQAQIEFQFNRLESATHYPSTGINNKAITEYLPTGASRNFGPK